LLDAGVSPAYSRCGRTATAEVLASALRFWLALVAGTEKLRRGGGRAKGDRGEASQVDLQATSIVRTVVRAGTETEGPQAEFEVQAPEVAERAAATEGAIGAAEVYVGARVGVGVPDGALAWCVALARGGAGARA